MALDKSEGVVKSVEFLAGRWPAQAWFWLEWGSSTAGQSLPAARSRFRAVHSDSISTRPSQQASRVCGFAVHLLNVG